MGVEGAHLLQQGLGEGAVPLHHPLQTLQAQMVGAPLLPLLLLLLGAEEVAAHPCPLLVVEVAAHLFPLGQHLVLPLELVGVACSPPLPARAPQARVGAPPQAGALLLGVVEEALAYLPPLQLLMTLLQLSGRQRPY
jgi:hypothetical protein